MSAQFWPHRLARAARLYVKAIEYFGAAGIALVTTVGILQVFFRYVLDASLYWSDEVMRYTMIWTAMLLAGVAYSRGEMLGAEMLIRLAPARFRRAADIFCRMAVIGLLLVIAWYGVKLTIATETSVSPAAEIQMSYIYASVPIGCFLLALHVLVGCTQRHESA